MNILRTRLPLENAAASSRDLWTFYLHYFHGALPSLLAGTAVSVLQCLLVLPTAFLIRHAFDTQVPAGRIGGIVLCGVALLALNLTSSAATLWVRHLTLGITKDAIQRLRIELLDKCYALSRTFHDRADRARLHASIVQDTERLDNMSNALLGVFLPALVVCAGLSGVLIWLNPALFAVMALVAPPMLLAGQIMKRRTRHHVRQFHRGFEDFSKGMLFVLEKLDLTRMQSAEAFERARQAEKIEQLRGSSRAMAWITTAHTTVQKTISTTSSVLILIVGGIAVARNSMSLGELLSFFFAGALLNHHLAALISALPQIYDGRESLGTIHQLLRASDLSPYEGKESITFQGGIRFEGVHFSYGEQPLLRNLDFSLAPGRMVALLGPNGAGKTTIIHLIAGFYRPSQGRLLAEGIAYEKLDLPALRAGMAIVPQDPVIFPGTILDNIIYGMPEASLDEVRKAAQLASADQFIDSLPQAYETPTGEDGVLLSGGQRQRIALARALLRRPRLLILDEPTTHLDQAAAAQLFSMLRQLSPRPAILCITHEMALAGEADEIVRLHADGQATIGKAGGVEIDSAGSGAEQCT